MYTILINLALKIFLLVLLGYWLRKKNIIDEDFHKKLNSFLTGVLLPFVILNAANSEFSSDSLRDLLAVTLFGLGIFGVSTAVTLLLGRWLAPDARSVPTFSLLVTYMNTGFIGFPLLESLYGEQGLLYGAIFNAVWDLFFFTIGIATMSGGKGIDLKQFLKNPVVIATVVMLVVHLSPFRFPAFLQSTISSLSGMVVPLSMILIGCSLTSAKLTDILRAPSSYAVSVLRLLVCPAITLGLLLVLPGISPLVSHVVIVMSCLPTGVLCAIYADRYDRNAAYASVTIMQQMFLMILTVPVFVVAATALFPL